MEAGEMYRTMQNLVFEVPDNRRVYTCTRVVWLSTISGLLMIY